MGVTLRCMGVRGSIGFRIFPKSGVCFGVSTLRMGVPPLS